MQLRLDYITRTVGVEPAEPNMSDREFATLAARVDEYLVRINDR